MLCVGLSLFFMSARFPSRIWAAVTTGRWNYFFQFRKPVSSCFSALWHLIAEWRPVRYLPPGACVELLVAIGLAPLMETNLRSRVDLLVTSSDACESGAGIIAFAGLSTSGVVAARALPRELPAGPPRGCVLVSLFGGIEAGRRAFDLLSVKPLRHLSVEIDRAATRNTQEVYPDAVLTDDIRVFDESAAEKYLGGIEAVAVIVLSGSPCQDVSGLNATKVGISGSRSGLVAELVRVVKLLQQMHF